MQYTTTMSQKGQIVIPVDIRRKLKLKPSDPIEITLSNGNIVAKPGISTNDVFGMFKVKKPITKKDIKQTFKQKVAKKYNK